MNEAQLRNLIAVLDSIGVTLRVEAGRLLVSDWAALSPAERRLVRRNRDALVALLAPQEPAQAQPQPSAQPAPEAAADGQRSAPEEQRVVVGVERRNGSAPWRPCYGPPGESSREMVDNAFRGWRPVQDLTAAAARRRPWET